MPNRNVWDSPSQPLDPGRPTTSRDFLGGRDIFASAAGPAVKDDLRWIAGPPAFRAQSSFRQGRRANRRRFGQTSVYRQYGIALVESADMHYKYNRSSSNCGFGLTGASDPDEMIPRWPNRR